MIPLELVPQGLRQKFRGSQYDEAVRLSHSNTDSFGDELATPSSVDSAFPIIHVIGCIRNRLAGARWISDKRTNYEFQEDGIFFTDSIKLKLHY